MYPVVTCAVGVVWGGVSSARQVVCGRRGEGVFDWLVGSVVSSESWSVLPSLRRRWREMKGCRDECRWDWVKEMSFKPLCWEIAVMNSSTHRCHLLQLQSSLSLSTPLLFSSPPLDGAVHRGSCTVSVGSSYRETRKHN